MRKVNPDAKKAMNLMYSEKISLAEAWKRVKGTASLKSAKRSKRRLSKAKNSLKLNRIKMCKRSKGSKGSKKCRRSKKRSMKRSRGFGSVSEAGPGYLSSGSTSVNAPYFGKSGGEPYVNPSEWFLPVTNGQVQSPQMLYKS